VEHEVFLRIESILIIESSYVNPQQGAELLEALAAVI